MGAHAMELGYSTSRNDGYKYKWLMSKRCVVAQPRQQK